MTTRFATPLSWKPPTDCSQRCFNLKEYLYVESADAQSASKKRKISNFPEDESGDNNDKRDIECKEVTESDCYFSSDPSNCGDWLVSLIRLEFTIRISSVPKYSAKYSALRNFRKNVFCIWKPWKQISPNYILDDWLGCFSISYDQSWRHSRLYRRIFYFYRRQARIFSFQRWINMRPRAGPAVGRLIEWHPI